ncbi:MAG: hypothetical protein ACI8RZ_006328 [Myxococcota bacterium]
METRKNRMSIAKLRSSDANTLLVLTQDALSLPLGQIEPATLVDLLAISELQDQLPKALAQDLRNFQLQAFNQITDLPDGAALAGFVSEVTLLEPTSLPQSLRDFLAELLPQRRHSESLETLQALALRLDGQPPETLTLPAARSKTKVTAAKKTTSRKSAAKTTTATATAAKPVKKRTTRITASQVDDRKAEWIEEDVVSRLQKYGSRGLKEAILVAGARHRAPMKDLSGAEILAVMRRLKRESKVRFSAGRWIIS